MILQGHVLDILPTLEADSVDCVVTSPPYWGLRDYKIEPQVWDENFDCGGLGGNEHEWGEESRIQTTPQTGLPYAGAHSPDAMKVCLEKRAFNASQGSFCLRCGAWRGSLGLEPTPELYVIHIIQVFREVRRVLKPTGVCFVNLGDSYVANGQGQSHSNSFGKARRNREDESGGVVHQPNAQARHHGLKPKDLCGIPWRVAFALQADGWWLRSDIIWNKPNPMPESVTDRPTKSHEYIFLLTKSAKYFWNQEAVREAYQPDSEARVLRGRSNTHKWSNGGPGNQTIAKDLTAACSHPSGRNIRSVWTFATEPTPEAHFATFPQELVKRCILAGCPDNGTVLDPFLGSGTTGIVAENLYRKWIGIELNPEYIKIAEKRLKTKANIDQVNWIKGELNG